MERTIDVPAANDMPLERWTAYMYCEAVLHDLPAGTFSIGMHNGMSRITLNEAEYEKRKLQEGEGG